MTGQPAPGGILGALLKALVQGVIGALKAWWVQEKRVQAEWLAKSREGQLESFRSTLISSRPSSLELPP